MQNFKRNDEKLSVRSLRVPKNINYLPGKRRGTISNGDNIKNFLKSPSKTSVSSKSELNRRTCIPRPSVSVGSSKTSKSVIPMKNERLPAFSNFARPALTVTVSRRNIMDRVSYAAGNSRLNAANKRFEGDAANTRRTSLVKWTPKRSVLKDVYLQILSESKRKSSKLNKNAPGPRPASEEFELRRNNHSFKIGNSQPSALSCSVLVDEKTQLKFGAGENAEVNERNGGDKGSTVLADNSKMENGNVPLNNKDCVFSNIFKHCQGYSSKLLSINNALDSLDESFQRVMAGAQGGQIYANFCQYQVKKKDLYREIELIEGELEQNMRNELNVKVKYSDYKKRKGDLMREQLELNESFKRFITGLLEKYEDESRKPASGSVLGDIVKSLTHLTGDEGKAEDLKREMGSGLQTPENFGSGKGKRKSRGLSDRKNMEGDGENGEFVIKRSARLSNRKRLKKLMYSDLQKSFNLCSPEDSF